MGRNEITCSLVHLFDIINSLKSRMKELGLFIWHNLSIVLIFSYFKSVEWTKDHDIQLAKEIIVSEPYRFKPRTVKARLPAVVSLRTVERGKMWQYVIANRLNEATNILCRVTKRSTRFHCTRGRIPNLI